MELYPQALWRAAVADLAQLGPNRTPSSPSSSLARCRSGEASSPSCLKEILSAVAEYQRDANGSQQLKAFTSIEKCYF